MESIVEALLREEVPRLRLGIAPEDGSVAPAELATFVLAPFEERELAAVEAIVERAADAALCWAAEGIETAMARFNAEAPPLAGDDAMG